MAILRVEPQTTHRDWDDVVKFPGRFGDYTYDGDPENWDLTHRASQWATVAAAAGGGAMLDPLHRYLAVKNMGTDPVLLHLNTQANAPNPEFEVTILPGHWVEYVDLWMTVQPSIRVDSALYSSPMECEVLQIGLFTDIDIPPEKFCDMWTVGHILQDGVLTKHHPEVPGPWEKVVNTITAVDHWGADVAGVAEDDYWFVGYDMLESFPNSGLFAVWDGAAWTEEDVESDPPQYGVWGFATDDYWSVGGPTGGDGEIWHWNGAAWTQDCVPDVGGNRTLYCIYGDVNTNIYAAGMDGLITSYNGVAWSPPHIILNEELSDTNFYGTWTSSAQAAYVCGGDEEWWVASGGTGQIMMETFPGSMAWQEWILPVGTGTLRAMWGFNDFDIWAVGDQGSILHYNGVAWSAVPEPAGLNGNYDYRGVFGCWPWAVWAVGTSMTGDNVIIYWDGLTWQIDDGPDVGEGDLLGLKGVWVES